MSPLEGKTALVTGASRGIGRAIAERLGKDGAAVAINYVRSEAKAFEVVSGLESKGTKAVAIQADLSAVSNVRRLFDRTVEALGGIDILVNNAGLTIFKPVAQTTEEEFELLFSVNARASFFAMQEAARRMRDGGRIINISTIGTVQTGPGSAAYSGSKAAIEQFSVALSKELGKRGITVNTVSPGFTETDNFNRVMPTEAKHHIAGSTPLGRIGQPVDIADIVAFLASDAARWVTGQNIRAAGGLA